MTDLYKFFTTWLIILAILKPLVIEYIDLFFLAIIVFVTGFYLSYIDPGFYRFSLLGKTYTVRGCLRMLTVDLIHIALLLYLWPTRGRLNFIRLLNACVMIMIYHISFDIRSIYIVDEATFSVIIAICIYLYIVGSAMLSH